MFTLRYYQTDSADALIDGGKGSVVSIPTGAGKTLIMAEVSKRLSGHVLILSPSEELVAQNAKAISSHTGEPVGIYCAGLGKRDITRRIMSASIQSLYSRIKRLGTERLPQYDTIIIDECHSVPNIEANQGKIWRHTLDALKCPVIYGLSATPFRTASGDICSPNGTFKAIVYEAKVKQLMMEGFLCKIVSKPSGDMDLSGIKLKHGKYDDAEVAGKMHPHTQAIVQDMITKCIDRKHCLIFASGLDHCNEIATELRLHGESVAVVTSKITKDERREQTKGFEAGKYRWASNNNIFSTGYDFPAIDAIILLRMTESPGFFYQACGRGFRLSPDKKDCLILDYGTNIERHGPLNAIGAKRTKERWMPCPCCEEIINKKDENCEFCGFVLKVKAIASPKPIVSQNNLDGKIIMESDLDPRSSTLDIMCEDITFRLECTGIKAMLHVKPKGGESSTTLKIMYSTRKGSFSEYLCFSDFHHKFAVRKGRQRWEELGGFHADTEEQALGMAGTLVAPKMVSVSRSGEYFKLVGISA